MEKDIDGCIITDYIIILKYSAPSQWPSLAFAVVMDGFLST